MKQNSSVSKLIGYRLMATIQSAVEYIIIQVSSRTHPISYSNVIVVSIPGDKRTAA
jgi:hypothetical protein